MVVVRGSEPHSVARPAGAGSAGCQQRLVITQANKMGWGVKVAEGSTCED